MKDKQQPMQACSVCGISGLHACPGKPLPKPTKEDKAKLSAVLSEIFGK